MNQKQFGEMPESRTIDSIFILGQLEEEYFATRKEFLFQFVNLQKALARIPRDVVKWALVWWKLGAEESLVKPVQCIGMLKVQLELKNSYNDGFLAQEELHQNKNAKPSITFILSLKHYWKLR